MTMVERCSQFVQLWPGPAGDVDALQHCIARKHGESGRLVRLREFGVEQNERVEGSGVIVQVRGDFRRCTEASVDVMA